MKICIVIPAHNEAKTIGHLVGALRGRGFEAVVIDDGSTDSSAGLAQDRGAFVIRHARKQGKGVSLRDGFAYAMRQGFDGVIAMDGDGQHAVEDIALFVAKARQHPDAVINGNRMHDCQRMPFVRQLVNRFMSLVISLICRQRIPDSQCGFRFIGAQVLKSIELTCDEFEIETEVLIKSSRKGFKIDSVPIKTIYRGELSKINPWRDTVRFFKYIFKEISRPGPGA